MQKYNRCPEHRIISVFHSTFIQRFFFFKEFVFLLIFLSNSKEAVYEISPKSEIKLPLVICTALVFLVTTPSTISKV
jgi:hypothetical protein